MPRSDSSVTASTQRSKAPSPSRQIGAGELSRAIVEALAGAGKAGVPLDELKRKVAAALDEPAPPNLQEQLDVLLTNRYVKRDPSLNTYCLTSEGEWLVQGIEVVHG
jgi:hypothetical protein